jgi:hypothetical protein
VTSTPPPAPAWATRSIPEDGGITHEHVHHLHPHATTTWPTPTASNTDVRPTQVSVSVVDQRVGDDWERSGPTLQIEAGSYPLPAAADLARAIDDLVAWVTPARPARRESPQPIR